MDYKLFEQIERSFQAYKRDDNTFVFLEVFATAIFGKFAGKVIERGEWSVWLFISAAAMACLVIRRLSRTKNFALSGLGELKASAELETKKGELGRKDNINIYVADAITALNSNTCNYNSFNAESYLCDQSVVNGFEAVYKPFFNQTAYLLETQKSKFTVGVYLNSFFKHSPVDEVDRGMPEFMRQTIIPHDDLNLREFFVDDPITNLDLTDLQYDFQKIIQSSYKHNRFEINNIDLEGGGVYSVISAPVPTVCDDGAWGVFFIVAEGLERIPDDLENVTLIFGRLFSNWLTKYNECVEGRYKKEVERIRLLKQGTKEPTPPELSGK